jgi:site-specific recombinase XerD
LDKLIDEYLEYRKTLNLSRDTLKGDRVSLAKFKCYLAMQGLALEQTTPAILRNYSLWLISLNPGTRRKYLVGLKGFYQYLWTHHFLLQNPFRQLELPRDKPGAMRPIPTPGQLRQILDSLDLTTRIGLRDRAILELVYSSGLRANETVGLDLTDLDLANRLVYVKGKGRKERVVPFGKTAAFYLKLYLKDRAKTGSPALFQGRTGERITRDILEERFRFYNQRLGMNFKFHSLRHACAVHMLQNNAGIRHIQELLGHCRLETTQIYTRLLPLDLQKAHRRYHPREREVRHG